MMRSLFSGVGGLKNHQTRMDVIGNNIANVNTAGFKGSRVTFQDMLSQSLSAASAPQGGRGGTNSQQVGLGMGVSSIDTNFGNGSVQSTGRNTDLCISDAGFFILGDGTKKYYTRSGAFEFDTAGNYVVPGSGLHVQGWMADELGNVNNSGQVQDIKVPAGQTMAAKATDSVTYSKNLSAEGKYATTVIKQERGDTVAVQPKVGDTDFLGNAGFTVTEVDESGWNVLRTKTATGTSATPPTPPTGSALKSNTVTKCKMEATFDYTTAGLPAGLKVGDPMGDKGYKVTAIDTTTNIVTIEREVPVTGGAVPPAVTDLPTTPAYAAKGTPAGSEWTYVWEKTDTPTGVGNKPSPTNIDADGFKVDTITTTSWLAKSEKTAERMTAAGDKEGVVTVGGVTTTTVLKAATVKTSEITAYDSEGVAHKISVNITKTDHNEWTVTPSSDKTSTGYLLDPPFSYVVKFNEDGTFRSVDNKNPITFKPDQAKPVSIALDFKGLTQYSGETTAAVTEYTGYPAGALSSVSIDSTGTLVGKFTNNMTRKLAQVALATFNNPTGLIKNGTSLYSESNNSGIAQVSIAMSGGAGSLTPNSLEMSNVDISEEFSNMIITQRGFQSNSKIITVSDEMLDTLINMKR